MRQLNPIGFDDEAALISIANNKRLSSYDALLQSLANVRASYTAYVLAGEKGTAWPAPCALPVGLDDRLRLHFSSPPSLIKSIIDHL